MNEKSDGQKLGCTELKTYTTTNFVQLGYYYIENYFGL